MKSTGIIRRIDELGRLVLPKELRDVLNIKSYKEKGYKNKCDSDALEVFINGEEIILKKYQPGCHCCDNTNNLIEIQGIKLCPDCVKNFNQVAKAGKWKR